MAASVLNLTVEQGATFQKRLVWRDKFKKPINLTGYSARLMMRATADAPAAIDLSDADGITLGGVNGTIDLRIEASDTAALTFAAGLYDLILRATDGTVIRLLQGKITVSRGITLS